MTTHAFLRNLETKIDLKNIQNTISFILYLYMQFFKKKKSKDSKLFFAMNIHSFLDKYKKKIAIKYIEYHSFLFLAYPCISIKHI